MKGKEEIERLKTVYKKERKPSLLNDIPFLTQLTFFIQRRDWEIINILKRQGVTSLEDKRIIDVGCGMGRELINLIRYGVRPENLFGIDLLEDRIAEAKSLHPYLILDAAMLQNSRTQMNILILLCSLPFLLQFLIRI